MVHTTTARKTTTRKVVAPRKTAEERQAQAKDLQASIATQVENLRTSDQWQRFLDFSGSFHRYSLNNLMLILAQCPTASAVAGFRQWQGKGRQVRKGERAIKIFGFAQKKINSDEAAPEGEQVETDGNGQKTITYFPVLSVFDIGQTELIDPDGDDPSQGPARRLTGADDLGIVGAVTDYLTGKGWTVTHEEIPGETNGYTTIDGTKRVVIDSRLAPAQQAKTALHEAAHVILHAEEGTEEYVAHRGLKETEAESVAYVVAGLLGLDTTSYSIGYVAGWSEGKAEVIRASAANVLRAVHVLAEAITDTEQTEEEAAPVMADAPVLAA